mgnify:CR=1 FL=1
MNKLTKEERQNKLIKIIDKNPFLTDEDLAKKFGVSIQTIRLDRLELNIPEVRKRTKKVAHSAYKRLKSVNEGEVFGELIKLQLNKYAESYMITTSEMSLQESNIIRGHHIFAQANSLAVAVIDANFVLTGSADLTYHKPVYISDELQAKAVVKNHEKDKVLINVNTDRDQETVFTGNFIMFPRKQRGDSN